MENKGDEQNPKVDPVTRRVECVPDQMKEPCCSCCCSPKPAPPAKRSVFSKLDHPDPPVKVKKVFVVMNPHGGNGRAARAWPDVKEELTKAGVEFTLFQTQRARHATEAAKQTNFDGYDAIVVMGGDGTIQEVLQGLHERADAKYPPVGLIPGGTGNSVCVSMEVANPVEGIQNVIKGYVRRIDTALVTTKDNVFVSFNEIGWGIAALSNVTAENLRCFGRKRYDVAGFWHVLKNKRASVKFIIDGHEVQDNFSFALIQNNQHSGFNLRFAPYAKIDDGYLDMVAYKRDGRMAIIKAFDDLKHDGLHVFHPNVAYWRFKKLELVAEEVGPLNIDGENCAYTPVTIECQPQALPVFYNADKHR